MNVTIKDIAEKAGVSYSTVSKALNNSSLVKADTKNKIITIAKKMGYKPNFAAQQLASNKTKVIGLIWPTIERVVLSTLVTKISDEIHKTPYTMILSIEPIQKSLDTFKKFQVDGIILFEENTSIEIDTDIPFLSYGVDRRKKRSYPMIDPNHEKAMLKAVKYLYELGHKKIAYFGDLSSTDPMQIEKYNGFIKAINLYKLPKDHTSVINTHGLNWYDGFDAVNQLLDNSDLPTAILGGSYDISGGVVRGLKEKNIHIPVDISLVSYDNIPQMANMEVPLTCIGVPVDHLAKEIVRSTIQLVEGDLQPHQSIKMTPKLQERMSCCHSR